VRWRCGLLIAEPGIKLIASVRFGLDSGHKSNVTLGAEDAGWSVGDGVEV